MEETYKYRIEQLECAALSRKKRLDWMIGIAVSLIGVLVMYISGVSKDNAALQKQIAVIQARQVEIGDDLDSHEDNPNTHEQGIAVLKDYMLDKFLSKETYRANK